MTQDPADTPPEDSAATDGASAEVPQAFQAAPAFAPNGHGTAKQPLAAQQTAQGVAQLVQLFAQFPQAFAAVLSQVPVRVIPAVRHLCVTCIINRLQWEARNKLAIETAMAGAAEAANIPKDDPRRTQLDWTPHLPEHLQPGKAAGMPALNPAVTTVGGNEVCAEHIPGHSGAARTLVIAQAALSPQALAGYGG